MKLSILNAYHYDTEPGGYQEQYMPMFLQVLEHHWPECKVREYKVAQNEFPEDIDEQDLFLITGSPKSAYDSDAWIKKLKDFIFYCDDQQKKMVGLCFGHQIMAEALGGRVEKAANGWGVGVREFEIIESKPWMKPNLKKCSLLFSHQDQVMDLPPTAIRLATDEFCPNQMFAIGKHIFCLQGHPEFTPEYARQRLDSRIDRVGRPVYDKAIASLDLPANAGEVWQWIKNFSISS